MPHPGGGVPRERPPVGAGLDRVVPGGPGDRLGEAHRGRGAVGVAHALADLADGLNADGATTAPLAVSPMWTSRWRSPPALAGSPDRPHRTSRRRSPTSAARPPGTCAGTVSAFRGG